MSKGTMRFQSAHSRNGYCWSHQTTPEGRHVFLANGDGVRKTCGLVVTAMGRYQRLTKSSAAEYLRANFDESFTSNDLSSVFRQLTKHGIARKVANSHAYVLTAKGKDIWRSIDKEWI
jgi:hypothetical protein